MRLQRDGESAASILDGSGDVIAELIAVGEAAEEFRNLVNRIARLLGEGDAPKVVLSLREGVLTSAHADERVTVVLIEDDPLDVPPLHMTERRLAADNEATEAAIAFARQRIARLSA